MSVDHLVFLSIDTLRSDCVGANPFPLWPRKYPGLRAPRTPGLDALAAEGTFFPRCLSAAPYTSASHASFFTGSWPLRHGVYEFFHRRLRGPTIFSVARRLGYRTIWNVDFPLILGPFLGLDRDVDHYTIEDDDGFLERIRETPRAVSFAHFGGAHLPYGFHNLRFGGEAYRRMVCELEREVPPDFPRPEDQLVESWRDPEDLALLLRYKRIVQHHMATGRYHRLFELYLDGVEHFCRTRLDPFLERLRAALRGRRALVVLFGDHGEEYDAESYGHHNTLAEGVLRVPLMIVGHEVEAGVRADRVRSIDVVPTLLDLLGWTAPELGPMDGFSFADTIRLGTPVPARPVFAQAWTADTSEFVRFQQRLLATKEHPGFLRHVLYKEAVIDGGYRLERQTHRYVGSGGVWGLNPCPPRVRLDRPDGEGWAEADDAAEASRLGALLDQYGTLLNRTEERAVPGSITERLRAMGYPV